MGSLKSKAKAASDPNSEQSLGRQIGDLERKLASERLKNQGMTNALKRAQDETCSVNERLDLLLETSDKIQQSKLHKLVKKQPTSPATAILCCSDWHAEESVDPESVGGLNEFNLEIASRRIKRLWNRAIYLLDFSRHVAKIDDLVLWLGGDLINNVLHFESMESNFLGPSEAILWVQDQIANGIEALKPHFKTITVVANYGNHSRTTKKRHISTGHRHSWEWLAYQNLAKYFSRDSKLTFQIAKGYHSWLNVQGHDVRFHHGDAVKFGGGLGGLHIPLRRKLAQWNKARKPAFDVLGHFHQYIDDWHYVVNGCLVGTNAYAIEIGAEHQTPTQTFITVDRNYGRVITLPIFVEEAL